MAITAVSGPSHLCLFKTAKPQYTEERLNKTFAALSDSTRRRMGVYYQIFRVGHSRFTRISSSKRRASRTLLHIIGAIQIKSEGEWKSRLLENPRPSGIPANRPPWTYGWSVRKCRPTIFRSLTFRNECSRGCRPETITTARANSNLFSS